MSLRRFLGLVVLFYCLFLGCAQDGGPGPLNPRVYGRLRQTFRQHPRLILTLQKQQQVRDQLGQDRKWLWDRYLQDLPSKLAASTSLPASLDRSHGDLAADLAFAWCMTESDSLLEAARGYLLNLCSHDVWDPEYDLLHGHLLMGAALAYDWLFHGMSRAQRLLVADRLGREAQEQYLQIAERRAWYRNQYLQNHAHVNFAGLAFAAVALYGEDPRAQTWLDVCDRFFDQVFKVSPDDGSSIEGLSYGNYALEFCLRYAELADQVLGRDYYTGSRWLKAYPDFVLHSLLPRLDENEWAMTFGDSPRHGNSHGPEPQLFLLAARYRDSQAQWLAERLVRLRPDGLDSASWWAVLWYDPTVRPADPAGFPTVKHFEDLGQVMLRTGWLDSSATLIGIKCGPFMGLAASRDPLYDLGCAHAHPDAGSFQLYYHGQFLALDPLYTHYKMTSNHNTVLLKGQGQLGEKEPWFAAAEAVAYRHYPTILEVRSYPEYDYVVADVARAYHPALGLKLFQRHFLFLKPDLLLVADDLVLDSRGSLFSWPADSLALEGGLRYEDGYVVGVRGKASAIFQGGAGAYQLAASYIDNSPETGYYALMVDSDTVYSWQDTVHITDTHLTVTPSVVKLAPGSRISFVAEPMGEGARLVKLCASGRDAPAAREALWLLHLEPGTTLERKFTRIEASLGSLCLDVYPLAPERRRHDWGTYRLKSASWYDSTQRLEIAPVFMDSSTVMLTLLHARTADSPPLAWVRGAVYRKQVQVSLFRGNQRTNLNLDLEKREVSIQK